MGGDLCLNEAQLLSPTTGKRINKMKWEHRNKKRLTDVVEAFSGCFSGCFDDTPGRKEVVRGRARRAMWVVNSWNERVG